MTTTTTKDRAVFKLIRALDEFRKLDSEFPIQIAQILLIISDNPGISNKRLMDATGLSKSSVARNVSILTKEYGRWPFVLYYEDPEDRRNKLAKLTPDGQRFIRSLVNIFEE